MVTMSENHDPIRLLAIRETPLSLDEVYEAVGDDAAGSTTVFVGTVRDHDGGKSVAALEYSAHPTAEQEMRRIAEKIVAEFPVRALAAVHRIGRLRHHRQGGDRRGLLSAPGRGVRGRPSADRRPQARGADLEAPGLHRRRGGMGRRGLLLTRPETRSVASGHTNTSQW